MPDKPRILVVDQDPRGCTEIQQLLAKSPVIVVGGVGYDEEALSLASELKPQIIFVALEEHTVFALETLRALAGLLPETTIVTYAAVDDAHSVHQAKALGAREHLTKPLSLEDLTSCIGRALNPVTGQNGSEDAPLPDHRGATIFTIFGPKGGVGRTLIAVNLAASMAQAGLSPLLIDLDSASGDVARRMKLKVERSLLEAAQRAPELDELTIDSYLIQHPSGVSVLPAPRLPTDSREIDPAAIDRLLTLLAKAHQSIIIDTPATFTDLSILAANRADAVILVSSPDPSSIGTTAMAIEMLRSANSGPAQTSLILNHPTPANSLSDADAAAELACDLFWSLPYDESIACRDEAGRPAVIVRPKARISRSISKMASLLAQGRSPAPEAPVRGNGAGLFGRVLGLRA